MGGIIACSFRNFARAGVCFKCGEPRLTRSSVAPEVSSTAIVSYQPQQVVPYGQQKKRPQLFGLAPVATYGVVLSGVVEDEVNMLYAAYPRRLPDVGIVQGCFPLVPGERFQVTIHSRGTFGEISVGLAPSAQAEPTPKSKDNKSDISRLPQQAAAARPRGSGMVGWATRELGLTGDHGRWYFRGELPGRVVTSSWQDGDIIECGLNEGGGVYMQRNGTIVAGEEGYWPAEDAYPTVTFHSGGTEVLLDLRDVSRKRPRKATHAQKPAEVAKDLLSALKRTVLNGGQTRGSSFWCSCTDVQVRRPEPASGNRFRSESASGR